MREGLSVGHEAQLELLVSSNEIIRLGGTTPVFSTPSMINLMEHAARKALAPYLEDHEESVGANVTVDHLAATPIGKRVRAVAKVTAIDRALIDFEITAFDETEQIGKGTHRRAVIKMGKLRSRLADKEPRITTTLDPNQLPTFQSLKVVEQGAALEVALNHPSKLNAIDAQTTAELVALTEWLEIAQDRIRVVILCGEGKTFCAGDDVKEASKLDKQEILKLNVERTTYCRRIASLPQIFIANIHGHCLGGGFMLAAACDFRYAANGTKFGLPEIKLGWPPAYTNLHAIQLLGKAKTMELSLTGNQFTADKALAWGFINKAVPLMRLESEANQLRDNLLQMPPIALRETKQRVAAVSSAAQDDSFVDDLAAFYRCLESEDGQEGLAAFVEKRRPVFIGN
jgi:enoyl-CoA hydratase/carnithine racemase/predicted thioesterase